MPEAVDKVVHAPKQSSVIAFRETSLRSFYRNFATLVFPHDFSGNPDIDSNRLFLLIFLDTRLRGYDGIFLRFFDKLQDNGLVSQLM